MTRTVGSRMAKDRFEGVFIPDAIGTAEGPQRGFMNQVDGLPRKDERLIHWASFPKTVR